MEIHDNLTPQMSDANITVDETAPTPLQNSSLRQGSPEWKALLYQGGLARGALLPPEATSREAIYGDDLQ